MERAVVSLRRAIAVRRAGRRRARLSEPLRSEVLGYVGAARQAGRSYRAIATALGVPVATAQGWSAAAKQASRPAALRPVRVATGDGGTAAPAERGLALVSPGGWRVEGLSLESVRTLLLVLGG